MCQLSKRFGKFRQAEMVHHIFPREEFPQYEFDRWNLISITRSEHKKLHDQNTGELTEAGRDLLVRTARHNRIEIPEKYQQKPRRTLKRDRRNIY